MDTANPFSPTEETPVKALMRAKSPSALKSVGIYVSRYGLVVILLLIGVLKFSAGEAQGIQPLVANSPLMFWLYRIFRTGRFQSNRNDRNQCRLAYRQSRSPGRARRPASLALAMSLCSASVKTEPL
jgi:uncharacterized membrane protein YkgB